MNYRRLFHNTRLVTAILLLLAGGYASVSLHRLAHDWNSHRAESPVKHQSKKQDTLRDECLACTLISSIVFDHADTVWSVFVNRFDTTLDTEPVKAVTRSCSTPTSRAPPVA